MSLQGDRVGHYAEEANEGKSQADGAAAEGDEAEFWFLEDVELQPGFECCGLHQDYVRIDVRHDLAEWIDEEVRIGDGANDDGTIRKTAECVRNIGLGHNRGVEQFGAFQCIHHADDFEINVMWHLWHLIKEIEFDLATDGILVGKIIVDEFGIDYGDAARSGNVGCGDEAATKQLQTDGREITFTDAVERGGPMFFVGLAGNGDIV